MPVTLIRLRDKDGIIHFINIESFELVIEHAEDVWIFTKSEYVTYVTHETWAKINHLFAKAGVTDEASSV